MKIKVVANAKKNITTGVASRIVALVCPFVLRSVLSNVLGPEYLGLNSLFASIVSLLGISELGLNSAVLSSIYKPLADNDTAGVNKLLNFYKKSYQIIGVIIIAISIGCLPFLRFWAKGSIVTVVNIYYVYFLYVANAAIGYFLFSFAPLVIVAHQRDELQSKISMVLSVALLITQVIVLIAFKDYYAFCLSMLIFTTANCLWLYFSQKKNFPSFYPCGNINKAEFEKIKKLIAGTFIQKLSSVSRHALDSIFISSFLGLSATASYNNYYLIIAGLSSLVSVVCTSFTGGVGNHVTLKSIDNNYKELKVLDFVYLWIGGISSACIFCMIQPFITIWLGDYYLLSMNMVMLFCIYYYCLKLGDMRFLYTSAKGLWWENRYRCLVETIVNIALNYLLGKKWGMYGIILASIITILIFNHVWGTYITFNKYFGDERKKDYYKYEIKNALATIIGTGISYWICSYMFPTVAVGILQLILRFGVCIVATSLVFALFYGKSCEMRYVLKTLRTLHKNRLTDD